MAKVDLSALQPLVDGGYITARPHPTADLMIYNYTQKAQFERVWTEETLMCRGLITTSDGTIVARPFKKFFNYEEHQGDLPLEPFKVTEKMDGSLGILYFVDGEPYIATRGSFESEQAVEGTRILREKFGALRFDPSLTYLFEIIYPTNRIVIDYGDTEDLVLLAIIDTETGEEVDIHDTSPVPSCSELTIVRHYDGVTDIARLREVEEANREGVVIRFESGLRLKLKFAEYVRLHRLITQVNARVIWDLLRNGQSFDELLERVPDEFYTWVSSTRDNLIASYRVIEDGSLRIYDQVKDLPTRREQAEIVKLSPYAPVVFMMLDGKNYAGVIWKQLRPAAERPFKEDAE